MTFTVTVDQKHHDAIVEALTEMEHVEVHESKRRGIVRPPDGNGLSFTFVSEAGSDEVKITVVDNPQDEPEEKIKARIQQDLDGMVTALS